MGARESGVGGATSRGGWKFGPNCANSANGGAEHLDGVGH